MYAVVKTGGKQYKVAPGEKLKIEQIPADVGAEVVLDQVLMVGEGETFAWASPSSRVRRSRPPSSRMAAARRSRSSRCGAASTTKSIRGIGRTTPSSRSTRSSASVGVGDLEVVGDSR